MNYIHDQNIEVSKKENAILLKLNDKILVARIENGDINIYENIKYSIYSFRDFLSKDALGLTMSALTALFFIMVVLFISYVPEPQITSNIVADPQIITFNLTNEELSDGYVKTISITNKYPEQVNLSSSVEGTIKNLMKIDENISLDGNQTIFTIIEIRGPKLMNGEYRGMINIINNSLNESIKIPVDISVTNISMQQNQAMLQIE